MKVSVIAAALYVAATAGAHADEFAIQLKPGNGRDLVQTQCAACHSLDYIQMNAPFLNSATWTAEVTKMISAYGADIGEADAKEIAAYLSQTYGGK